MDLWFSGKDLSKEKVLVSLSAGINSAAAMCYLATEYPDEYKPKIVFIKYIHLREHSSDSLKFVKDCIRYAAKKFECVKWSIEWNSVNKFFEEQKMIPHPILSPCTDKLKVKKINEYKNDNEIYFDLVGYIRTERNRIKRQQEKGVTGKIYPISSLSEDDCFYIVDKEIGWHPAIYDIRDEFGNRVFKHNNCLPCKNFQGILKPDGTVTGDYAKVKLYFPEYHERALETAIRLNQYWGRKEKEDEIFDGYCHFCEF